LADYLALEYTLVIEADPDGGYVAHFPDLVGCATQGETLAEALAMAEDAKQGWLTATYNVGNEIPLPTYREDYSGRLLLRLPKSLHRQLAESAKRDGVSINQYIVMLLSHGEGAVRANRPQRVLASASCTSPSSASRASWKP
jgi:predicted RNase H-like HicB family nuclease